MFMQLCTIKLLYNESVTFETKSVYHNQIFESQPLKFDFNYTILKI